VVREVWARRDSEARDAGRELVATFPHRLLAAIPSAMVTQAMPMANRAAARARPDESGPTSPSMSTTAMVSAAMPPQPNP